MTEAREINARKKKTSLVSREKIVTDEVFYTLELCEDI